MKNRHPLLTKFAILFPIGVLLILFSTCHPVPENTDYEWDSALENAATATQSLTEEKQRGAHVFGDMDTSDFQSLNNNHVEWVTMVSWGFQDDFDSPNVTHHGQ